MRSTTTDLQEPGQTPEPDTAQDATPETSQALAASLVNRCRTLLSELDTFKALLTRTQRNPQSVEVRSLRSNVLSELKTLEKLTEQLHGAIAAAGDDDTEEGGPGRNDAVLRIVHALRSSNLPFYEAVWTIAKRTCTGLVALGKRFYWDQDGGRSRGGGGGGGGDRGEGEESAKKRPNKDKRKSVYVDIVADDGEEWVKVSTISETRLLFEMAEKGWEADSEDEDGQEGRRTVLQNFTHDAEDDEYYKDDHDDDDDDDEIELIKLAADMKKAASLVRVNYRHPRLRFVIPKIEEGQSPDIDELLKVIRSYGIIVSCGENIFTSQANAPSTSSGFALSAKDEEEEVCQLLPNRFKRFTPILNVDCTLLLAIVSDLSHSKSINPSPVHHKAINRQIEVEHERPLLLTELWPAMNSHELVCTNEAAKRMREIVETIGTDTEKKRLQILMGNPPFDNADTASLLEKLQDLSDHPVPSRLILPIRIVEAKPAIDSEKQQGKLPAVFEKVEAILSDINYSVFMYGWACRVTTISSNRTVVKQIETIIEAHRDDEDSRGPLIWVCDTARSLIGKEKNRKN
ncbi:hypothetical protein AOCH_005434 [Aspergillus ochraceoroseus]|uniref:DUF1308 domain-containing protein n=1 Tax=Aspergillus ochraceoroseus TaxID=138278 RepID=A0A0F8VKX9_9EURO|nr:hypothetical protein AOCH_005434 [Aspergillus ochraceoroseus]